jgi:hypothetical protein
MNTDMPLLIAITVVIIALQETDCKLALAFAVLMLYYFSYRHSHIIHFWETRHAVHMENHHLNAGIKVTLGRFIRKPAQAQADVFWRG